MEIRETEMRAVSEVKDKLCDHCGRSCYGDMNFCGIEFLVSGGYDSPLFPDDESCQTFHICEYCAVDWMKTFKHKPEWLKEYTEDRDGVNDGDFLPDSRSSDRKR